MGEEVEKEHMAAMEAAVNDDRPSQTSDAPVTRKLRADPALIARRARLRRVVAWVLGPAAIIAVIGGVKLASSGTDGASGGAPPPESTTRPQPLTTNPPRSTAPAATAAPPPEVPLPIASASVAEPAESAPPEAASSSSAPPVASDTPPEPDAPPTAEPAVDVAATKKLALKLLNQGKFKDALPVAESALAADPTDANLYLYVGTALEELGRRKDAVAVYSRCVHEATKGPKHECRAVGGK